MIIYIPRKFHGRIKLEILTSAGHLTTKTFSIVSINVLPLENLDLACSIALS